MSRYKTFYRPISFTTSSCSECSPHSNSQCKSRDLFINWYLIYGFLYIFLGEPKIFIIITVNTNISNSVRHGGGPIQFLPMCQMLYAGFHLPEKEGGGSGSPPNVIEIWIYTCTGGHMFEYYFICATMERFGWKIKTLNKFWYLTVH